MERHKGKLQVTFDALRAMLRLPPEARIMSIECTGRDAGMERFYVYVEHPNLPGWTEGENICPVGPSDFGGEENIG